MSDKVTRNLEKRVLSGDLTAVPSLARAYERVKRPSVFLLLLLDRQRYTYSYVFSTINKALEKIDYYIRNKMLIGAADTTVILDLLDRNDYEGAIELFATSYGDQFYIHEKEIIDE